MCTRFIQQIQGEFLQGIQLCQENLQVPVTRIHNPQISTGTHTCTGTAQQEGGISGELPHHGSWWSSEHGEVEDAICDVEEQLLAQEEH